MPRKRSLFRVYLRCVRCYKVFAILLLLPVPVFSQADCDSLFNQMLARWNLVDNISYLSLKDERSFGEVIHTEIAFNVQKQPYKALLRLNEDGEHNYVLYDSERSRSQALYIPDGFPYKNLWLDIHGSLFRGSNHYTVTDAGFESIFKLLKRQFVRDPGIFRCRTSDGQKLVIEAHATDFRYVPYTGSRGETVSSIADKLGVSAYLILERNNTVDAYSDDCSGLTLQVPNQFAQRVVVEVSPRLGLPVRIEVYDDQGLLERFIYKDIRVNAVLPEGLFTEDYIEDLD